MEAMARPLAAVALAALVAAFASCPPAAAAEADEWARTADTLARADQWSDARAAAVRAAVTNAIRLAESGSRISRAAAAAQAGHDVLVSFFPWQRERLDTELAVALIDIVDGPAKTAGIAKGKESAARTLAALR